MRRRFSRGRSIASTGGACGPVLPGRCLGFETAPLRAPAAGERWAPAGSPRSRRFPTGCRPGIDGSFSGFARSVGGAMARCPATPEPVRFGGRCSAGPPESGRWFRPSTMAACSAGVALQPAHHPAASLLPAASTRSIASGGVPSVCAQTSFRGRAPRGNTGEFLVSRAQQRRRAKAEDQYRHRQHDRENRKRKPGSMEREFRLRGCRKAFEHRDAVKQLAAPATQRTLPAQANQPDLRIPQGMPRRLLKWRRCGIAPSKISTR